MARGRMRGKGGERVVVVRGKGGERVVVVRGKEGERVVVVRGKEGERLVVEGEGLREVVVEPPSSFNL